MRQDVINQWIRHVLKTKHVPDNMYLVTDNKFLSRIEMWTEAGSLYVLSYNKLDKLLKQGRV